MVDSFMNRKNIIFLFMFFVKNDLYAFNNQIGMNNTFNTNPAVATLNAQNNANKKEDWNIHEESNYDFFTRFNWYERNETRKSAYFIYNSLLSISDLFKNIINVFNKKIEDVDQICNKLDQDISAKLLIFNLNIHNLSSVNILINKLKESIKYLEETKLFQINKDLKKEIAKIIEDVENLVILGKQNVGNYNLIIESKSRINNSIGILSEEINKVNEFERLAWNNYKKLDEIISDSEANALFEEIKNYFDNTESISLYIKNDYREFFNRTINNINTGTTHVLQDLDKFILEFQRINTEIDKIKNNEKAEEELLLKNKALEEEKIKNETKKKEEELKIKMLKNKTRFQKFKEFVAVKMLLVNTFLSNIFHKTKNFVLIKFGFNSKNIVQKNIQNNNNNNNTQAVAASIQVANNNLDNNIQKPMIRDANLLVDEPSLNAPNEFFGSNVMLPKYSNNKVDPNLSKPSDINLVINNTSDSGISPNFKPLVVHNAEVPPIEAPVEDNANNDVKITELIDSQDQTAVEEKKYSEDEVKDDYRQEIVHYDAPKDELDSTPLIDTNDEFFKYANATQSGGIAKAAKASKQIQVSTQLKSSLPQKTRSN